MTHIAAVTVYFLGRALILKGAIYEDDGEVHFSVPFKCKYLTI